MIERSRRVLERLTAFLAIAGGLGLVFAMAVTCISIILKVVRRAMDATLSGVVDASLWSGIKPLLGEEELVAYAVGVALFAALPWGMMRRSHIRIDIFEGLFGQRLNRVLDLLADLSLAFVAYMILIRQWGLIIKKPRRVEESMWELALGGQWEALWAWVRTRPETQVMGLKEWPFYMFAEFCIAVFLVIAVFCCVESLLRLFNPRLAPEVAA